MSHSADVVEPVESPSQRGLGSFKGDNPRALTVAGASPCQDTPAFPAINSKIPLPIAGWYASFSKAKQASDVSQKSSQKLRKGSGNEDGAVTLPDGAIRELGLTVRVSAEVRVKGTHDAIGLATEQTLSAKARV